MKKYTFVDAQEMAQKHPETFSAPDLQELETINVGDFVKVCAQPIKSENSERFWVVITDINGNTIKGRIRNDLVYSRGNGHGLYCDNIIEFNKENIYQIQ